MIHAPLLKAFKTQCQQSITWLLINGYQMSMLCIASGNSSLTQLLLANNDFTGSIPVSILSAKRLAQIDITFNNLTGTLPELLQGETQCWPAALAYLPLAVIYLEHGIAYQNSYLAVRSCQGTSFCLEASTDCSLFPNPLACDGTPAPTPVLILQTSSYSLTLPL